MSMSVEFLLRLLEQIRPPQVVHEDFDGEHGEFLRACQEVGFLSREPGVHPVPSCPHCGEGVPYRLGERHLCNRCGSTVDPRRLRSWQLDPGNLGEQAEFPIGSRTLCLSLEIGDSCGLDGWVLGRTIGCFEIPHPMFSRPFDPSGFLRSVHSTEPFLDYCRERNVSFLQTPLASQTEDPCRWAAALAQLPPDQRARVELELAAVHAMAGTEAVAHLVETAGPGHLPPESVPGGAPLALWFSLHHPVFFHEVFLHHETRDADSWRIARGPRWLALADLKGLGSALANTLMDFFWEREGASQCCIVDAHRLTGAACFVARVADRTQSFDIFTAGGRQARHQLRPALPVLFVYHPRHGTVLLKSHVRSRDRTVELFQRFGQAVLGSPVACDDAFDLEPLKRPFHPLPDADDMELVRVKTLHLRYPERAGRQQLNLQTLTSDDPRAMDDLLRAHVSDDLLADLRVAHSELHVRLRVDGWSKNHLVRLWPDRCDVGPGPVGDRLLTCLRRWGLLT
jgi:hypothetical protein